MREEKKLMYRVLGKERKLAGIVFPTDASSNTWLLLSKAASNQSSIPCLQPLYPLDLSVAADHKESLCRQGVHAMGLLSLSVVESPSGTA